MELLAAFYRCLRCAALHYSCCRDLAAGQCYRGEALWLEEPKVETGVGGEVDIGVEAEVEPRAGCRAWAAEAHLAPEVTRGFPVSALACSDRTLEVAAGRLEVQALCLMEDRAAAGGLRAVFTHVISGLLGLTTSLWGARVTARERACPPGFSLLPSGCFLFLAAAAGSAEEAVVACEGRGARLADLGEGRAEVADYWAAQRPGCRETAWWWVAAG
jgi:hypothetical protein